MSFEARIRKDLDELTTSYARYDGETTYYVTDDITMQRSSGDWRTFRVTMTGPVDAKEELKEFQLVVRFPDEYPAKPPRVKFITKISHQCVNEESGEVVESFFGSRDDSFRFDHVFLKVRSLITVESVRLGRKRKAGI